MKMRFSKHIFLVICLLSVVSTLHAQGFETPNTGTSSEGIGSGFGTANSFQSVSMKGNQYTIPMAAQDLPNVGYVTPPTTTYPVSRAGDLPTIGGGENPDDPNIEITDKDPKNPSPVGDGTWVLLGGMTLLLGYRFASMRRKKKEAA